ncbi:MAG TPA: N-formylglutamate amidohydrolase, partial [Rudaea sp.]|nr:N-formylglutamate amidohydrolase [Rudaea sp.]
SDYSFIVNGRFKGGYITRHYGRPAEGVEAVQLELAKLNYMDEDSSVYVEQRAVNLQRTIRALLEVCLR